MTMMDGEYSFLGLVLFAERPIYILGQCSGLDIQSNAVEGYALQVYVNSSAK